MTTATKDKTSSSSIPTRDSINAKDTWNLTDIYADDAAWEKDVKASQDIIKKASSFSGKLAGSSDLMFECLTLRTELTIKTARLYQYAKLTQDIDNRVSKYQAMTEKAANLSSTASTAFAFLEPELLAIGEKKLNEMAASFPKTDVYDFYVKELIRSSKHIRSQEVEELLAMSVPVARGADTIFTMLDDADITYPSIKDEDGNEVALTKQRYSKFMESSDPRVRKDAHVAFYKPYVAHRNMLGASLSTSVNKDLFFARARKFDSCLEASLFGDNIPTSVYNALLDTTESDLTGLNNWTSLRKRILKLDTIHGYDMICPLFPDRDYEVPYDQAVQTIIEALAPLGDDYIKVLTKAFESRWVDVYETEGKGSGAYSWGSYTTHPFVLMNYNDTVDNMFTLAHEMGHAMHSYLSCNAQPYTKSHYSTFVAEVASTLNEGLLLQHLLKKAVDDQDKLYLLNQYVDNTLGTFFNQVMYGRFELAIHQELEKGGALSPDLMNEIWGGLTQKFYGPALTMDELTPSKWSRIPHFYMTFYVYQYATSYAASEAILDKFVAGEDGIVEKYLTLISSGGNDYPIEQLKKCGVDMSKSTPFESTIKRFASQVEEIDNLTK